MAKMAAAAALGAAATAPVELFSYNKENFHFDAELRFQRFIAAYNYAIEQVEQYRQDVEDIVSNTMMKMDAWQSVLVLFLGEGAVLCTFGRLGLEGPALPSWHGALYTGSLFGSILMNGLSLWLAMHASLRAQCAATSLLTRKVRLPIPALSQLDNARVFGSAFEKQEYRDIFRVPFMRHPHQAPDMPKLRQSGRGSPKKGKSPRSVYVDDPHDTFASTARDTVPSWIRDEVAVDKGGHDIHVRRGETPEADDLPEHFGLLMEAQKEWRDYEIYARVSMLFGVMFWLHALCYFTIGSCVAEARGLWVMWSTPMLFVTAQVLILRLNIVRSSQGNHRAPHLEWLGHIAPYFAVLGNTLEYRQYYSQTQESVAWAFGFAALLGHLTMAIRMLDLSSRRAHEPMEEVPGKQWWPHKWHVPSAFTKHLWFITPPIKLEPGQHCLLHEMRSFAVRGGGVANSCRRRRTSSPRRSLTGGSQSSTCNNLGGIVPPQDQKGSVRADMPYFLLRTALISITVQWLFIMAASAATMIMGSEELLKPPGLPPWIRDIKHRHWTPEDVHMSNNKLPSDYRLFPDWQDPLHLHLEEDHHASDPHHGAAPAGLKQEGHAGAHHSQVVSEDQAENASFAIEQVQDQAAENASFAIEQVQGEGESYVEEAAGGYRRLASRSDSASAQFADPVLGELRQLMPLLGELFDRVEREARGEEYLAAGDLMQAGAAPGGFMAPALLEARSVAWPALFEPHHLLCRPARSGAGPAGVLALTPRGFGAHVLADGGEAQPFSLQGVDGLLAGAAWAESGLHLATRAGKLLHCPGVADGGSWPCRDSGHAALPVPRGSALIAAALSMEGGAVSKLAALFSHMPDAALLFRSAGAGAGWEPAAGTHAPQGTAHLAFDGEELLMSAPRGDLHRWHPGTGLTSAVRLSTSAGGARELRATCAPGAGSLLHLALRAPSAGAGGGAWRPELLAAPR